MHAVRYWQTQKWGFVLVLSHSNAALDRADPLNPTDSTFDQVADFCLIPMGIGEPGVTKVGCG